MSTLVTLGCSFTEGDGCYDLSLGDYKNDKIGFRKLNESNFLNNSIGSNIQNRFGFETFLNYGYGGSSNESQLISFFNNLPNDNNVSILWQLTFYDRKFQLQNQAVLDVGSHYKWFVDSILEKSKYLSDFEIEQDNRLEALLRINIMNEFCKSKGWKFLVWSWMRDEYEFLVNVYPKTKNIIIPYKNMLDSYIPDEWKSKLPKDQHPNELGYEYVSNSLCDIIESKNLDFHIPKEQPKEKIKVEPKFTIE